LDIFFLPLRLSETYIRDNLGEKLSKRNHAQVPINFFDHKINA